MQRLAIFLILSLCFTVTLSGETRFGELTEPFLTIIENGTYRIKATVVAIERQDMEFFKRGNNSAIQTSAQGTSIRIVLRDDMAHLIVDSQKMMIVAPIGDEGSSNFIDTEKLTFVETGQARFDGRRLPYDEYTIDDNKIQIFVNKDKLAGIRTFTSEKESQDLVVLEFDRRVPNMMFSIPTGYTVHERESLNIE